MDTEGRNWAWNPRSRFEVRLLMLLLHGVLYLPLNSPTKWGISVCHGEIRSREVLWRAKAVVNMSFRRADLWRSKGGRGLLYYSSLNWWLVTWLTQWLWVNGYIAPLREVSGSVRHHWHCSCLFSINGGLNKDQGCQIIHWCAYTVVRESNFIKYQDWYSKSPQEGQIQLHEEVLNVGAHDQLYRWGRGGTAHRV